MNLKTNDHKAEKLIRYCDGELGASERRAFERQLASSAELSNQLAQLRHSDQLIRAASAEILSVPPPAISTATLAHVGARRRRYRLPMAVAASIFLLGVGTLFGWRMNAVPTGFETVDDDRQIAALLSRALESRTPCVSTWSHTSPS